MALRIKTALFIPLAITLGIGSLQPAAAASSLAPACTQAGKSPQAALASNSNPIPKLPTLEAFLSSKGLSRATTPVYSSIAAAQKAGPSSQTVVISDGSSHVLFERGKTYPTGNKVSFKGVSYGADLSQEVQLLAFEKQDGASIQQALNLANAARVGVRFSAHQVYTVTNQELTIHTGVKYLEGSGALFKVGGKGTKGTKVGDKSNPFDLFTLARGSSKTTINNMAIDFAGSYFTRGFYAEQADDVTVSNLRMKNVNFRGIQFMAHNGNINRLTLRDNQISAPQGTEQDKDLNAVIVQTSQIEPNETYSRNSNPVWARFIAEGNVITGGNHITATVINNDIHGGYYGLNMSGASNSYVAGNSIRNNVRNISMQNNSCYNTVENNRLSDSSSSAVHLAYNSGGNLVRNNTISSQRATGQGLLQAYQASQANTFTANTVNVGSDPRGQAPLWILYVGTGSHNTVFERNVVSGAATKAVLGIESIWDRGSANSGFPNSINNYSYMTTTGNITYNGGRGPLKLVRVRDNILASSSAAETPIAYLGAEVSKGLDDKYRFIGDLDGIAITGNQYSRTAAASVAPLISHEGFLDQLGRAKIIRSDRSLGRNNSGATQLTGSSANDSYLVDHALDSISDPGGNDTVYSLLGGQLQAGLENMTLLGSRPTSASGNAASNQLVGNSFANELRGGAGADRLAGREGADTLFGEAGRDEFVFDSQLLRTVNGQDTAEGVDTIKDFKQGEDSLVLSSAAFGPLEGAGWFTSRDQQRTVESRIVQRDRTLYYDADGPGSIYQPIPFAQFEQDIVVKASDFKKG